MMTNIDKLIESLEGNEIEDEFWWDILGGINKTKQILSAANRETPDEYQVIILAEILGIDLYNDTITGTYKTCIRELKKELSQLEN